MDLVVAVVAVGGQVVEILAFDRVEVLVLAHGPYPGSKEAAYVGVGAAAAAAAVVAAADQPLFA